LAQIAQPPERELSQLAAGGQTGRRDNFQALWPFPRAADWGQSALRKPAADVSDSTWTAIG